MNLDSPHVHPLSNELYQLDHAIRVLTCGYGITVKEGFITDGVSIPRILWRICGHPLQGRLLAPAIVHDALYQSEALDRRDCDRIFHALLLANGVNKVKARVLYWGVRMGGGYVWDDHDLAGIETARGYIRVVQVKG